MDRIRVLNEIPVLFVTRTTVSTPHSTEDIVTKKVHSAAMALIPENPIFDTSDNTNVLSFVDRRLMSACLLSLGYTVHRSRSVGSSDVPFDVMTVEETESTPTFVSDVKIIAKHVHVPYIWMSWADSDYATLMRIRQEGKTSAPKLLELRGFSHFSTESLQNASINARLVISRISAPILRHYGLDPGQERCTSRPSRT